ncbi:MAG: TPM domain-containing protein [Patescibacteria group bacterium]
MRKIFFAFIALLICCEISFAVDFPKYQNFVNDYTNTLSQETVDTLNTQLKSYETETGTEIAIILIDSTGEMPIWEYATELGNEWGVGKDNVDNGAILVIAKDDREMHIATGSQLEGALTDLEAKDVVDFIIAPHFKNGDFDTGVINGVAGIFAAIARESFTDSRMGNGSETNVDIPKIIFFAVFLLLPWLGAILGRSKRIWPGAIVGGAGGAAGGLLLSFALWGIAAAVVGLGLFGLFFDWIVSRNYQKAASRGGHVAWWAGGGRGGFGRGGFGGFGGGGFSGGGAGGSW